MIRRLSSKALPALLALTLLAGACGSDSDPTEDAGGTATTTTAAAATTEETTTSAQADTTTSTTAPEPEGPTPLPLDDIPELVAAWGEGTGDPLDLAQLIVAFPVAIPLPAGTAAYAISVDLSADTETDAAWEWDWRYEATTDAMPDIDLDAEGNGPGAISLREAYDPIMADLGWTYSNSTASDPSSGAGGPQSVNHVYVSDAETLTVDGLTATPKPVFVWADEELIYGEGIPGYRVDVPLEFDPGVIPVPLVQTIIDALPAFDGAGLMDVGVTSWQRGESSFDAEFGLRYFDVAIEWVLAPGGEDAAKSAFSELDGPSFLAGSESFFDPGFFEPSDPIDSAGRWNQELVFLDRYSGDATIEADSDGTTTLTVKVAFEPNRAVLEPEPT